MQFNAVLNLFRMMYQIHQDKKRAATTANSDGEATKQQKPNYLSGAALRLPFDYYNTLSIPKKQVFFTEPEAA